jgi:replicative DNA helicase
MIRFSGHNVLAFGEHAGFLFHKLAKYESVTHNYRPKRGRRSGDLFMDRIKSIEYVGEKETWDLSVRGCHSSRKNNSFCVNEFITHNSGSLEQDADIILFLHRNDYYRKKENPNTDEDGKAELIIAKNRRGKTGSVNLVWLPQYFSFGQEVEEDIW